MRKMGKKCFCDTTDFCDTKNSPQKPLALTGIQLQSRIKNTLKNEQTQELKFLYICSDYKRIEQNRNG